MEYSRFESRITLFGPIETFSIYILPFQNRQGEQIFNK